jgi:uncharacterized protein (TIGR02246 family)
MANLCCTIITTRSGKIPRVDTASIRFHVQCGSAVPISSQALGSRERFMVDEFKRIEELYATSTSALTAGDLTTLSTIYADDAIQFPPNNAPLMGWAKIRESIEKELNGITFSSVVELSEIVISGEFAYVWGSYRGKSSRKSGAGITRTSGSFLDVLARQPDGTWRIARSSWSNHKLGNTSD